MSLLTRLKMGAVLTKDSLLVIRHNPRLLAFPIVSGITAATFLTLFLGVTFGLAQVSPDGGVLLGLLGAYFVLTFLSSFFTAALVHQTRAAFAGEDVSLGAGVRAAWDRKGPLLVWSVVAATVGVLINALENADSRIARLMATVFSVGWTLLTFFIIPVIVFERRSSTAMFRESGRLFKDTYGETPVSLIAVQVVGVVVALPLVLVGAAVASAGLIVAGIGLVLLGVAAAFIVSQTLQGVVKTALYYYATEGIRPEEFEDIEFDGLGETQDSRQVTGKTSHGGFV